jgi:hypothetical protein
MVTVITRTIGPSGRDYASFTLAEADVTNIGTSANLVANDEAIVFEADAGTYTEYVTFNSSLTTDATRNVTYKPAAGSEHGGVPGAGVVINASYFMVFRDDYMLFDGMEVNGTGSQVFNIRQLTGLTVRNCIVDAASQGLVIYYDSVDIAVENCVLSSVSHAIYPNASSGTISVSVRNCTVKNGPTSVAAIRIAQSSTATISAEFVNHLHLGGAGGAYTASGTVTVTGSNNFGGSTNPFPVAIQGSPYPITPTTNTSPGAGDWAIYKAATGRLYNVAENDVWQQGVGPSVNSDVPTTDIDGVARSGATCNPGAFEASVGKVYYRHFAGTISGSPGSTSTISFDTALDAASDLKAIIIFAVDAKGQNDPSNSTTGNGPMESYGFTDLTNEFCSDSSHRDEATGANLGDMSSSINSSLLHLYDESADSTFAKCSYTSHTTSGFTVTWATQPSGSGTQMTYTGYAICGPNVEAEARSDWISSTTAATVDTVTFSSLTGLEAVNIISVPDMATLGSRRLENCGINRAWLNSNGDSNAVLEKHALESDGAIRTVQGGFDNGVVSGTSRTDAHYQWKWFYQVSGAISGNDLDLTIGSTNLTWGLRYMCLGLYLDGAATGQATNDTDTSTAFTPSPTVTNPGVIDGMVCGIVNATTNQDSSYSQAWTGTVFDESDTTVGAFGMGSTSSANLTVKQNIVARTTPQNLPNSSSLYYRAADYSPGEKHAYVSSVNNTTGEVTIGWTPSQDTVAGRHGVYFVLGQQPDVGGGGGGAAQTVTATGIASSEAFGTPTATAGTVQVSPQGIASGEAFGTPSVSQGAAPAQSLFATGIASGEAFGTPSVSQGAAPAQSLFATGIASGEAFGSPTLTPGAVTVTATGIASVEAFGTATVQAGGVTATATAIGSDEAFGTPTISTALPPVEPTGIASQEAFGTPVLDAAGQVRPVAVQSAEAFGTAALTAFIQLSPGSIASAEAFGRPALEEGAQFRLKFERDPTVVAVMIHVDVPPTTLTGQDRPIPGMVHTVNYYARHLGWSSDQTAAYDEPSPYGGDKITVIVPPIRGDGATP